MDNSEDAAQLGVRRTSESLRELMLKAGVEVLEENGLELRPDSISYAKVFAYLEQEYSVRITRGSVHERIWASHDDFRREVLALSLLNLPLEVPLRLALGKDQTISEFSRRFLAEAEPMQAFARWLADSVWAKASEWESAGLLISMKAIASRFNDPITAEVLRGELDRRESERFATRPEVLRSAFQSLNLRSKPTFGLPESECAELLFLMFDSIMLGGCLNVRAGCHDLSDAQSYHPFGSSDDARWTTGSVASVVFFDMLLERCSQSAENDERTASSDLAVMQEFQNDIDLRTPETLSSLLEDAEQSGQRRTRNELKRLVLTAGQELFLRDGLVLQPEALRYSAVLAHIQERHGVVVNRASVHGRIWATHADYCLDVIARSVSETPASVPTNVPSGNPSDIKDHSPADRRMVVLEQIRRHMLTQVELMTDSQPFRQRLLAKAALANQDGSSAAMDELCRVIKRTDDDRIDFNIEVVSRVFSELGFEVKPGIGLTFAEACELLTQITQVVVIGMVFNQLCGIDGNMRRFSVPRSDDSGELDEWNLPGLAVRACFEHFFQDGLAQD